MKLDKKVKVLREIVKKDIITTLKKHPRMITEHELNKTEHIELSYTGEIIPIEVVEEVIDIVFGLEKKE